MLQQKGLRQSLDISILKIMIIQEGCIVHYVLIHPLQKHLRKYILETEEGY